jgi:hypothetical protein
MKNKKTNESLWRVGITTAPSGKNPPERIERNLQAPDANTAVARAAGMNPNVKTTAADVAQLDQMTKAPTMNAPDNTQNSLNQLPIRPGISGPVKIGEGINPNRFKYPYSITLPASFASLMETVSPVKVNERYGQYHIELRDDKDMRKFLQNLSSHKDKYSVNVIFNGLRSTMRVS